ncbi:hypothetical protein [[Mycoplasma] testudinis]|uniref:hypothetical protein n=1 Tax=[Mycoplasma] testudinis TaxID=33924 RepID=UPI0004815345|nr:hypothetical protein [[Mycoplasma] testudinis]
MKQKNFLKKTLIGSAFGTIAIIIPATIAACGNSSNAGPSSNSLEPSNQSKTAIQNAQKENGQAGISAYISANMSSALLFDSLKLSARSVFKTAMMFAQTSTGPNIQPSYNFSLNNYNYQSNGTTISFVFTANLIASSQGANLNIEIKWNANNASYSIADTFISGLSVDSKFMLNSEEFPFLNSVPNGINLTTNWIDYLSNN